MRYQFFKNKNEIICVSSFAKKRVRGIAKCAECDEFDETIGRQLAQIRCDLKINEKRIKYRRKIWEAAKKASEKAYNHVVNTYNLYGEAIREKTLLEYEYTDLMNRLK